MTDKLDGFTMDIEATEREKLRSVFPQCFIEGKLDIDKLLNMCGEYITDDYEKYEFKWKGKSQCLQLAQKRSTGTLRPCPEESVNWDNTENLYIEGDNLEVLKLLQTSYYRKVKMIYIDPPYNTGKDFVYEDDFADNITRYKEVTSQTTKSNPETMGRYHTNWLNMMYPRLRLAANLLLDDGVIFISIDDNEVTNLRKVCDEVFGEENFISSLIWQQRKGGGNDSRYIAVDHEYIVIYGKSLFNLQDKWRIKQTDEYLKRYNEVDETGKYYWDTLVRNGLQNPIIISIEDPDGTQMTINSQQSLKTILEGIKKGTVKFTKTSNGWSLHHKVYMNDGQVLRSLLVNYGNNRSAADELSKLFGQVLFDYAKPTTLVNLLMQLNTNDNDIILDFFSGSATTAHAVMQLNKEDDGNRKFILVQLPELCDEKSEAYKAGYKNICEIGKERIRRAGAKLIERDGQIKLGEEQQEPLDIGFKVFKLDTSNFRAWDNSPVSEETLDILSERLNNMIYRVKDDRSDMDMVYEIMHKLGVPLTETVTALNIDSTPAYAIREDHHLLICLASGITTELIEKIVEAYSPTQMIFGQDSFKDLSAMSNAKLVLKDRQIDLKFV
jgi:adenine-specific DNA-methyltransferase